jgi:hypothetical protein
MHKQTLVALIVTVVSACAVSRVDNLSVPLAYKSDPKSTGLLGGLACTALSQVTADDARHDKTLGVRVHESKPLKAEVTTTSDVAAWAQGGAQSFLTQNGVVFQGGAPKLHLAIDSLHTTESIWHRSSYSAALELTAQVQSATGKSCWSGSVQGEGGNYGYTGSVENYQETLNRALDSAIQRTAAQQGFKDALCHCGN